MLCWNEMFYAAPFLNFYIASLNSDPGWFVSAFSFWELHLEVKYEGMERWLFTLFYISSTMMLILDIEGNCSRRRGKGAKISRSCNSPERLAWEWPGSQGSNVLNFTWSFCHFKLWRLLYRVLGLFCQPRACLEKPMMFLMFSHYFPLKAIEARLCPCLDRE